MIQRKLVVSGFGTVGRAFVRLVLERNLLSRLSIVAIVDSRGAAIKKNGFSASELLNALSMPRSHVSKLQKWGVPSIDTRGVLEEVDANVLVELTPSNYTDGEPGLSNVRVAMDRGMDIVLANKSPLALEGLELMRRAERKGIRILYRATVMGGTPLIPLISSIKNSIRSIHGILNATTNYILTRMCEDKIPFSEALKRAQEEGIAEADPTLDIDGYDPAAKLAILACTLGYDLRIHDIERESLRSLDLEEVLRSLQESSVPKYVARLEISDSKPRASVRVEYIGPTDPLIAIRGMYNGVHIRTLENEIFLMGMGAGGRVTAEAVLEDVLSLG